MGNIASLDYFSYINIFYMC